MSADWARVQWASLSESNVSLTDTPRNQKEELRVNKHIIEALASSTASVSSQRRRMGYTKGDRYVPGSPTVVHIGETPFGRGTASCVRLPCPSVWSCQCWLCVRGRSTLVAPMRPWWDYASGLLRVLTITTTQKPRDTSSVACHSLFPVR